MKVITEYDWTKHINSSQHNIEVEFDECKSYKCDQDKILENL